MTFGHIVFLLVLRWAHLLVHFPHRSITIGFYHGWIPVRYTYIGCECGRVWLDRCTDGDARALIHEWQRKFTNG